MDSFYDVFSKYYDKMGVCNYCIGLGENFLRFFRDNYPDEKIESHLDVCCGTGVLCNYMKEQGLYTTGFDLSEGMIQKAREGFPDIEFNVGDATTYSDGKVYDFATSTDDSLNHLPEVEMLKDVFRAMSKEIRPGGFFCFDMNNKETIPVGQTVVKGFTGDEKLIYYFEQTADNIITVRVKHQKNGVIDWEDSVSELYHTNDEIRQYLKETGFDLIYCASAFYDVSRTEKNIFIARRN